MTAGSSTVRVPGTRLARWTENFGARHGETSIVVRDGCLWGTAADGSTFRSTPPLDRGHEGSVEDFLDSCRPPARWGVLLVRKGGFAVARLEEERTVESKVGQRHVQGRTKAGGQSQQRFARRRDNQARAAYEAAAEHAARILAGVPLLVTGGDHGAVEAVLSDRRLARITVVSDFLTVPDPRRGVLEQAVADALAVRIDVSNVGP